MIYQDVKFSPGAGYHDAGEEGIPKLSTDEESSLADDADRFDHR